MVQLHHIADQFGRCMYAVLRPGPQQSKFGERRGHSLERSCDRFERYVAEQPVFGECGWRRSRSERQLSNADLAFDLQASVQWVEDHLPVGGRCEWSLQWVAIARHLDSTVARSSEAETNPKWDERRFVV